MINFDKMLEDVHADANGVTPMTSEGQAELREAMQSINWVEDGHARQAFADTIVKKLEEKLRKEDISVFFADVDRFGVGETPQYQFQKGLKAYVIEPEAMAPRSKVIKRVITLDTERVAVHPEFELSELESGRYGSLGGIKTMANEELVGRKMATLWTVLINSVTAAPSLAVGSNSYSWAGTGDDLVKKNFLVSGLDYVDDTAPGGVKAIVGRRSVLGFLNELTGYSELMKEHIDFGKSGGGKLLGHFRGVPVVALHQYTDGYDVDRINASAIMIVAEGTTKFAETESLRVLQSIDTSTAVLHFNMFHKYGAAIFWPTYNVKIAIS